MTDKRNTLAAALAMLLTKEAGHCISMPIYCIKDIAGFDLKSWCNKHNVWHAISHRTITFKVKASPPTP